MHFYRNILIMEGKILPGAVLVGAGCGSYELITLKGLSEIRSGRGYSV